MREKRSFQEEDQEEVGMVVAAVEVVVVVDCLVCCQTGCLVETELSCSKINVACAQYYYKICSKCIIHLFILFMPSSELVNAHAVMIREKLLLNSGIPLLLVAE